MDEKQCVYRHFINIKIIIIMNFLESGDTFTCLNVKNIFAKCNTIEV